MSDKTYTIEVGEKDLQLISRALDIYTRIGILQFNNLTDCYSLQKLIWDNDLMEYFDQAAKTMKSVFGYVENAGPGIFNTEKVGDDCRETAHMQQQIRHAIYLAHEDKKNKTAYTVDSRPADICTIAKIPAPNFKITLNDKATDSSYPEIDMR